MRISAKCGSFHVPALRPCEKTNAPVPEGFAALREINDEAGNSDSAAAKGYLCITFSQSGLLLDLKNAKYFTFVKACAARTKNNTKEKRTAALFSLPVF